MLGLKELLQDRKSALLIIDVQNEFCHPDGSFGKKGMDLSAVNNIMPNLSLLIAAAHNADIPVILIANIEDESTDAEAWVLRPDGDENSPNQGVTRRGSWGAEFYQLTPAQSDIVIEKHRFSAFHNTRLDTVLRTLGVQTLVIAGLATNVCVMTTATHAVMYGYHVVAAEDACAAWFQDSHAAALHNIRLFIGKVKRSRDIISYWQNPD